MFLRIRKIVIQNKIEIIALFIILLLYILLRIYNSKFLPIFVDEAIYARWAQLGTYDPSARLASLVDGKQPLYIWLVSIVIHYVHNPIAAGRVVSIGAGIVTLVGLFLLSFELFKNKSVSIISVLLYVLYPFALVVNRMGIYESLVGAFSIWSLYFSILLVRYIHSGTAFLLGLVLGAGLLTKSSGYINLYLIPTSLLLFNPKEKYMQKFTKWIAFAILACALAFLYYSVLLLSNKYYMISEKDANFAYHFSELISYGAFQKWGDNIFQLLKWVSIYLTYPIAIVALFIFTKKQYGKEKLLLLLWFIIPILGIGLFVRAPNPRYIFSITLPLLPLIAITLKDLYHITKNKLIYGVLIIFAAGFLVFSDYKILTDLPHSPIPKEEIQQYVNGFSSGEGLREIIAYLQKQSTREQIIIASEGIYGSLPTSVVEIFFINNSLVERYSFDPRPKKLPKYLYDKARTKPVYIIFNETQSFPKWPLRLIMRYKRGSSNIYLSLYRLQSAKNKK